MRRQNIGLTAWLLATLVMLIALVLGITYGLMHGPRMNAPPIGAGAGHTGGANAIGNLLAGHGASDEQPAPAAHSPSMVDPATLEQGFILIVTDKAKKATASDPIYFASNVTGWNPGDAAFKLTPQSDMRWRIHLTRPVPRTNPNEPIEFKFARGTWDACEVAADLADIGNRRLTPVDVSKLKAGEIPTIELNVEHWADERPNAKPAASDGAVRVSAGSLRRLQVQGGAGAARGGVRDLLVWLPPGYDDLKNADVRYPVLYMHDGQNLFDKPATAPGEWRMDETAASLIDQGKIRPLIIVGIPHSGATRTVEYMPPVTDEEILPGHKPEGDAHVAWLQREVMPRVERGFRVAPGAANTGIGGSSLGGLISLYAASLHPDVFGLVLAESPALRFGKNEYWKGLFASPSDAAKPWPTKVFLGVGGKEGGPSDKASETFADAVKSFDAMLTKQGLGSERKKFVFEAEAGHNEDAWAKRLPGALEFLFGK